MDRVRQPAVAGRFYPADPGELRAVLRSYLDAAPARGLMPKALIAPHAGYPYSGPIAAAAYARLHGGRARIRRVLLLGPAHRMAVQGLALPQATAFATPLGQVAVDRDAVRQIAALPQVHTLDAAHTLEHCLEVQLPFLQEKLADFKVVPLLVGKASPQEVYEVLEVLWGGEETLVVISSDLSHHQDYEAARKIDRATTQAIETLCAQALRPGQACGCIPIQGLLQTARKHGLQAETVDLRNSGDTAGPRDQVVGYGAYVFA
jgi:AmmeMemoRadiSam system protein B